MYQPKAYTLNLEKSVPRDAAIGVLQVIVRSARDIKGVKIGGGIPDPYVSLTLNDRAELAKTKYKKNTSVLVRCLVFRCMLTNPSYNPTWMETKFILVNSLQEFLVLNLMDYNDHRSNSLLGSISFGLDVLEQDATQEDISRPILKDGKYHGELRFDVNFYPVISLSKTSEGTVKKLPETSTPLNVSSVGHH